MASGYDRSPSKYVQEAVRVCKEDDAKSKGYRLPKRVKNPFSIDYCPKLDVFPVLVPEEAT